MKIKTKRYYLYALVRVGAFVFAILPVKVGLFLAEVAGYFGYLICKKEKDVALDNLRSVFPEKSEEELDKIVRGTFKNICKNAVEWINVYKLDKKNIDRWVRIDGEGFAKMDRAFAKGKGAIMLASHFGNWELIHVAFLLKGYPGTVIARRLYFKGYDKFIRDMRASKGVGVVYRDQSPKRLLRILKNNGLIGILGDQDMDSVDGVFVDFFGKPAYTPKAPAAFALRSGAALVPCFMIREEDKHRLVIGDPVEMEEHPDKDEAIKINTQKWSRIVESYIKKYPDQWVWMHKRWKTKPE